MPRWSVDDLRALIPKLQRPDAPSALADRLGLDTLRVRAEVENDGHTVRLALFDGKRQVGELSPNVHSADDLSDATRTALAQMAPLGVSTDTGVIFWSGRADKGKGYSFLLFAIGAAWAADRGMAVTGGAGLRRGLTSEDARATYARLATLLPHVTLAAKVDPYSLVPSFFAGSHFAGFVVPQERDLALADQAQAASFHLEIQDLPPNLFFNHVIERLSAAEPLGGAGEDVLVVARRERDYLDRIDRVTGSTEAEDAEDGKDRVLRALQWNQKYVSDRIGGETTWSSPLNVLYGGPLRGVLTGALGLR